jgi:DNA recombination protein RmuC
MSSALLSTGVSPAAYTAILVVIAVALVIVCVLLILLLVSRRRPTGPAAGGEFLERVLHRLDTLDSLTKDLRGLHAVLAVPHLRGVAGETMLGELLRTWLPARSFTLQHRFEDGTRVDAVIKLGDYLVPVDAKFPIERLGLKPDGGTPRPTAATADDLGRHDQPEPPPVAEPVLELDAKGRRTFLSYVNDIANKYIKPEEGTMEFALMYLPSERIYYATFATGSHGLFEESLRRKVVPVSPTTLFLYLQTVAYGLSGLAIPESREMLMQSLSRLRQELEEMETGYRLAGTHLRNLVKAFDESRHTLERVRRTAGRIDAVDECD